MSLRLEQKAPKWSIKRVHNRLGQQAVAPPLANFGIKSIKMNHNDSLLIPQHRWMTEHCGERIGSFSEDLQMKTLSLES